MIEAIDYALLLGEMEGVYSKLKKLGTAEEVSYLEELGQRYKQYFSTLKEERCKTDGN